MGDVNSSDGGIVVSNQANANAQANATAVGGGGGGQTQRGRQMASGGGVFVGLAILLVVLYWLLGPAMFMDVLLVLSIISSVVVAIVLVVWYHRWLKKQHYDEFFRIGKQFCDMAVSVLTTSTNAQAESIKATGNITVEALRVLRPSLQEKQYPAMYGPAQQYHQLPDGQTASMDIQILDLDDKDWQ